MHHLLDKLARLWVHLLHVCRRVNFFCQLIGFDLLVAFDGTGPPALSALCERDLQDSLPSIVRLQAPNGVSFLDLAAQLAVYDQRLAL